MQVQALAGGSLGILFGILVGLSRSPIVAEVATALGALLAAFFGLKGESPTPSEANNSRRIIAFALAFAACGLISVWVRAHDSLAPSPQERVASWTAAGFSERDGRAIVAAQMTGAKFDVLSPSLRTQYQELIGVGFEPAKAREILVPKLASEEKRVEGQGKTPESYGVFFGSKEQRDFCADLVQERPTPAEELLKYDGGGGVWRSAAASVRKHTPVEDHAATLQVVRAVLCEASP